MDAPPFGGGGADVAQVKTPSVSKACGAKREDHPEGLRESLEVRTSKLTTEAGTVICERCALAVRPWSRMVGLLGRASLDRGEGMLFRPASSIHMMFMRFAIDVVFCDRDLVVLSVRRGLKPWRFASQRGAKVAIELAEGASDGLEPGTRLVLATIDP
jgi:uncharacterized membrane protein (UPF0127 family)